MSTARKLEMPTITYVDGSGLGSTNRILVLTALTASTDVWAEFNERWLTALEVSGIEPPWHTTNMVFRENLSGPKIPLKLINTLGLMTEREFKAVSIAIDKVAAQELRAQQELHVPSDQELAVNFCLKDIGITEFDVGKPDCLRLLFDRNEPFIDHVKRRWLSTRSHARKQQRGWVWQTSEIEPVDAIKHPGIQAADLIAWAVRSTYEYGDAYADPNGFPVFVYLMLTGKHFGGYLNRQRLADLYLGGGATELQHHYSFLGTGARPPQLRVIEP